MNNPTPCPEWEKYKDIIELPHHVSTVRRPMPLSQRAAQFAPFAALDGHEEAIAETARLTSCRTELSEDEENRLNRSIAIAVARHIPVTITFFCKDENKAGGRYVPISGIIKKVDSCLRVLVLVDGRSIPLDAVHSLAISRFAPR